MKSRVAAPAVAVVLALLAAGCGGGDSSPAPEPPPPPPPPVGDPVASNVCQAFPAAVGAPVNGSLAGKATSPAGRALSFSVVAQPQGGTLAMSAAGAFTYTRTDPARGNVDSFTYRVTDTAGLTAEATAEVIYGRRRIMPLGDSITDGVETFTDADGDGPPMPQRIGYRKRLYDRLTQAGYAVDFVGSANAGSAAGLADTAHEGHSGYTQAQILGGITNSNWLGVSPDVVLLHIGTNDINQGSTDVADTDDILAAIDTRSTGAANPPVQLLLAKLIKQRPDAANPSGVATFNAALTTLYNSKWATAKPKFVVNLVDLYSTLVPATDLTGIAQDTTGLHPNAAGYEKMGDAWFDYLVQNKAVTKCE